VSTTQSLSILNYGFPLPLPLPSSVASGSAHHDSCCADLTERERIRDITAYATRYGSRVRPYVWDQTWTRLLEKLVQVTCDRQRL
jgi:hypothetical protein